jgi:2-oxoglutarate ferredoxin oxidoreductase subunit delta
MSTTTAEPKPDSPKRKRKPPVIKINAAFCKGCSICVAFCPTQVLMMKEGKAVVAHLEKCTTCYFCELRCPDFAIAVFPVAEEE